MVSLLTEQEVNIRNSTNLSIKLNYLKMNLINKLFLLFFIPITIMSQTQDEVSKYIKPITDLHNSFMEDYLNFVKKSDLSDVNKLGLISNLLEDHKLTLSNLEKINKANWDKGFLSDLISAHKIMDQNLLTSKEEYESILNLNEKFSNNEDIYKQLRITVKLNEYIANLSTKFKAKQIELYTQYNLSIKPSENAEFVRNFNERSSYYNNLNLLILPVKIGLEKIFNSYKSEDLNGLNRNLNNLTEIINKSEEKLNEINIIESGKNLFNLTNEFLNDCDGFIKENKNTFIETISLKAPDAPVTPDAPSCSPVAPDSSLAQKNYDKYKKDFDKYNKDFDDFEILKEEYYKDFAKYEKLIEDYKILYAKHKSQFKNAKSSLMQF